ncbi:MAG: hypothetical protein ACSHX7_11200 [Luteolibacter sp.]
MERLLSSAEGFHESGCERHLACVGDDESQPAVKLDAHLPVGRSVDLDFDKGRVGDAP